VGEVGDKGVGVWLHEGPGAAKQGWFGVGESATAAWTQAARDALVLSLPLPLPSPVLRQGGGPRLPRRTCGFMECSFSSGGSASSSSKASSAGFSLASSTAATAVAGSTGVKSSFSQSSCGWVRAAREGGRFVGSGRKQTPMKAAMQRARRAVGPLHTVLCRAALHGMDATNHSELRAAGIAAQCGWIHARMEKRAGSRLLLRRS